MGRYRSLRKSRNYRPVSNRRKIKKNRVPQTDDPKIRDNWDIKKSLSQNYASLGLSASLDKNKEKFDPEVTYPEPDLTIPKEKGPSPKLLTESELEIYCELMLVYGDDYKAMSRDMKLNPFQLTKKQLKKKCEIFKARYEGTKYDPIHKPYNQELYKQIKEQEENMNDDDNSE